MACGDCVKRSDGEGWAGEIEVANLPLGGVEGGDPPIITGSMAKRIQMAGLGSIAGRSRMARSKGATKTLSIWHTVQKKCGTVTK